MKKAFFSIAVFAFLLISQALAANYTAIDLNPSGYGPSRVRSIVGAQQVGFGYSSAARDYHALLWNSSADSYIDLNPSGFIYSDAFGISGTQQVGTGMGSSTGGQPHALLWSGTAASYVDLNPGGLNYSYANGTNGIQQIGAGRIFGLYEHALLWSGTAASFVDLNPSGYMESSAWGISPGSPGQQVGYGKISGGLHDHALLWNGTADSFVDLNPSGFLESSAYGTDGTHQVGYGITIGGSEHALLWNGVADNYIDLHQFVPAGYTRSRAIAIDSYGNIAGWAADSSNIEHAFLWQVPEPATLLLLGLGAAIARKRSRRK